MRYDRFGLCGGGVRGYRNDSECDRRGGLPGILSIQPKYMVSFAICMAIAAGVPFILTFMVGKKKFAEMAQAQAAHSAFSVDGNGGEGNSDKGDGQKVM